MINKVYKLIKPRCIVAYFENRSLEGKGIIVRPTKLSICVADQRYYAGLREKEVLEKKLPMSLIHEAVGKVVFDPKGEFRQGDNVVMIPNTPSDRCNVISENYLESSRFRASGYDGFMQDYVFMSRDRVIKYEDINHDIASFIELVSVAIHSIRRFESKSNINRDSIGIWGDGNLGFILALILKKKYNSSKIIVFGKNEEKLNFFSFADEVYHISSIPRNLRIDHGFEAVGGRGSIDAIDQMIECIKPEGTIALLGVSENKVEVDTRRILEKGIVIIGSSRSGRDDFEEAIRLLENNKDIQNQLKKIISKVFDVKCINDLIEAFEYDLTNSFKTVINWII